MQSSQEWIGDYLESLPGYSGNFVLKDSWDSEIRDPMDQNYISIDLLETIPIQEGEVGGPLVIERYIMAFDIYAKNRRWGQNLSSLIDSKLKSGDRLFVNDYSSNPPTNSVFNCRIATSTMTHMKKVNPDPWEKHFYSVVFSVEDIHNAPGLF